jgi:hypothetical protein
LDLMKGLMDPQTLMSFTMDQAVTHVRICKRVLSIVRGTFLPTLQSHMRVAV